MESQGREWPDVLHDAEFVSHSRRRAPSRRAVRRLAVVLTMTALAAIVLAPPSSADPTADLRSEVAARRGSCAALRPDPVLDGVAQRADFETQSYASHTARFLPMEDPMPMLRQLSYPAGKAKLLTGFAGPDRSNPRKAAIYGAALFGSETIPDCSYTRYGVDVVTDAKTGNATAAIVLVGD